MAPAPVDEKTSKAEKKMERLAKEYQRDFAKGIVADDEPFMAAAPRLLREPDIATKLEADRNTAVVKRSLRRLIEAAEGVHVVAGQDSGVSLDMKDFLEACSEEADAKGQPLVASMGVDWLHSLPFTKIPPRPDTEGRLLIYIGTPGKYLSMCMRSQRGRWDTAFEDNQLVVLCKGVCMLPLGTQEQNVYGVKSNEVLKVIVESVKAKGVVVWGHGPGSKAEMLGKAYGGAVPGPVPSPLQFAGEAGGSARNFDYLVEYVKYCNLVKMAQPQMPVCNWYDTGLLVSVLQGSLCERQVSQLTDRDGLTMLRDASIGHIISKMNQMLCVEPFSATRAVYNFWIGDGACRLNGGVESALHLMEGYKAQSMTTLWIFNNHKWAIEDNLVADCEEEHRLYNTDFYNILMNHKNVAVCANALELRQVVSYLTRRIDGYLRRECEPSFSLVVIRGLDVTLPPVLGDLEPIMKSPEMAFMRRVLGRFADGCNHRVPLYGCSAFEYIQYLHVFLENMPEGPKYQYVCGRTDIQAAHMCGYQQPDGKCVLFINDVYGVNSLGESLRAVLSGFGGKQLLIFIWHPSLVKVIDHFHLHRPPLVWPNLGPMLAKFYVRSENDALFTDFEGRSDFEVVTRRVEEAVDANMPLICVTMLPEQERDFVNLDIRAKAV